MMKRPSTATPDRGTAEAVGLKALVFVTQEPARLMRFLTQTGLSPDELRAQAGDASLQAAILEHLLGNESELLVFASSAGVEPQHIEPMRALLARETKRWEPSA